MKIGLSFAIIYAVIVALNYFLQLTVVRLNPQGFALLSMDVRPESPFWALEVLGYTFMSIAALFAVPVLSEGKLERAVQGLFVLNFVMTLAGLSAYLLTVNPTHVLVLASLGVWGIAFPVATALLAVLFKRAQRTRDYGMSPL